MFGGCLMRNNVWSVGTIAGIIATAAIMLITLILTFVNLSTLTEMEYAARFMLYIPGKAMETIHWAIGGLTNLSLGAIFGVLTAYLYRYTGKEDKYFKIFGIGVALWFFHLAIVPFLDPVVTGFSTASVAIEFYFSYLVWSIIASIIILKHLRFRDID